MISNRLAIDKQSELETRPAYQFCTQINSVITPGEKATKKRSFFEDIYGNARKQLAPLKSHLNDFKKMVTEEEAARAEYTIPEALAKLHIEAGNNLETARATLKQVSAEDETGKATLISSEEAMTNNLRKEEEKLSSTKGDNFDQNKQSCDKLRAQLAALKTKQKDIEKAIEKKHPGCFPWRVKKERHDWSDANAEITKISVQIAGYDKGQQGYTAQEKVVADLRKQLEEVQQNITAHTAKYPALLNNANDAVVQAQIKYEQSDIDIQKNKSSYYASLSDKSMASLVRLYAAFLNYKKEMDAVNSKTKNKDIARLNSGLSLVKGKLDDLMTQLWCPDQWSYECKRSLR